MADELTLQLDKLIKEMQYPTSKKRRRRRNKRRNEVHDHRLETGWNNGTSPHMSKLPSYDALRDPHCTYTRKRQFRIHHERYKQVAIMSEILRGDHAALGDVLSPALDSPRNGPSKKAPPSTLPSLKRKKKEKRGKKSTRWYTTRRGRKQRTERIYEEGSDLGHGGDPHNPATKARKEAVKKDQNIENIRILTGK